MPYNHSRNSFERYRPFLDKLLPGKPIAFKTDNPHMLAYHLREAIGSAKLLEIEPYNQLAFAFKQDHSKGIVIAAPKLEERLEVVDLEQSDTPMSFPEASSVFEVVTTADRIKSEVMVFPNFIGDVDSIRNWAIAKGYEVTLEDPLTMRLINAP